MISKILWISKENLFSFIKFGIVGTMGLVIDFSLTWMFKEYYGWNEYLANLIGFCTAVINNYYFNRVWTFNSSEKKVGRQFIVFILVSLTGLALNTLGIYIFYQALDLPFYWSKALAIVLVFFWNFLANLFLTFKKKATLAH